MTNAEQKTYSDKVYNFDLKTLKKLKMENIINTPWDYEICKILVTYYPNTYLAFISKMGRTFHYTDTYLKAVDEEISYREFEKIVLKSTYRTRKKVA